MCYKYSISVKPRFSIDIFVSIFFYRYDCIDTFISISLYRYIYIDTAVLIKIAQSANFYSIQLYRYKCIDLCKMTNEFIQYKCINLLCKMTKNIFGFSLDIFNISAIIIHVRNTTTLPLTRKEIIMETIKKLYATSADDYTEVQPGTFTATL